MDRDKSSLVILTARPTVETKARPSGGRMRKRKATGVVAATSERRHDARVHVHGSVVVHAQGWTRGRVLDVSSGGVCFHVADGDVVGPRGTRVTMQLRLDGAHQRWVRLDGRIGRVGDDGT